MKPSDVLADLQRTAARLDEEMATFPNPEDQNVVETFRGRLHQWLTEVREALEPSYPERWDEMSGLIRVPRSARETPLLVTRSALRVYRERLAALMHGWTD